MSATAYNDNQQLAFTQELRRKLVDQFMVDGKFPDDPEMVKILLSALKDYDRVTLTLKRIDADSATADADRQVLAQFHRISAMLGSKDFAADESTVDANQEGPAVPFDPNDLPAPDMVEGEMMRGLDPVQYDSFMEEQSKIHQERLAAQERH